MWKAAWRTPSPLSQSHVPAGGSSHPRLDMPKESGHSCQGQWMSSTIARSIPVLCASWCIVVERTMTTLEWIWIWHITPSAQPAAPWSAAASQPWGSSYVRHWYRRTTSTSSAWTGPWAGGGRRKSMRPARWPSGPCGRGAGPRRGPHPPGAGAGTRTGNPATAAEDPRGVYEFTLFSSMHYE